MNCDEATKSYEAWLGNITRIIEADLQLKHQQMSADIFSFMRATFYRWLELWPERCADLTKVPAVLGVGDLHVENFGTWRDAEGRLVWGVNDFDEAFDLPYTNDLVRLATSAHLAIAANHLVLRPADACQAILKGYAKGLKEGGPPFVLAEHHDWLRATVMSELREPQKFWEKLNNLLSIKSGVPRKASRALISALLQPSCPILWFIMSPVSEVSADKGSLPWSNGTVVRSRARRRHLFRPLMCGPAERKMRVPNTTESLSSQSGVLILFSICARAGSCAGLLRTAVGLNSRCCQRVMTSPGYWRRWVVRRRIFTSGASVQSRRSRLT
jgi:hypothetical protein